MIQAKDGDEEGVVVVETIHIDHLPLTHPVHAALFTDVQNAATLRRHLLAGNQDFEYAFIDAAMIVSRLHVLAAAFRAIGDLLAARLKTRNVHSEIVFALSPSNNIADSFRRFGLSDHTKHLLVLKVAADPALTRESVQQHLLANVEGRPVAFQDAQLAAIADEPRIRKAYKLPASSSSASADTRLSSPTDIEVAILGAMALRGAS